ncbi:hypothetical protein E2C01_060020 [Portunus trituberculatus]|uniref:Uncharacterized protein n=1 Tax=Portunus trituberculatus TaxID=210409 RepID=A0A5B7H458_PORTR|nr:hypothetical protein [Portunus trituberculatus]
MKKWFLKPEWSKEDEEGQSVVFGDEEPQHDPDDFPPPPPLDDEDEDDGSYDTTTPTPPACPPEMDGVEGNSADVRKGGEAEEPRQQQVSDEARKRFSELFEQEVKPRRLFQVSLAVSWCVVVYGVCCGVVGCSGE